MKFRKVLLLIVLPIVAGAVVFWATLPMYRTYNPFSYPTLKNPFPGDMADPPEAVVNALAIPDWAVRWRRWDTENVEPGEKLFQANCAGCHGKNLDGRGQWATAFRFPAQPADLRAPGGPLEHASIQALFWRISEGGINNEFNSAMPSWGTFGVGSGGRRETVHSGDLSNNEIWEILRYMYRTTEKKPVIGQMEGGGGMAGMPGMPGME